MKNEETLDYLREQKESASGLVREIDEGKILDVIEAVEKASRHGGTVYTIGNGGSASTAKHLAADLDKTVNEDTDLSVKSKSLVSNEALLTAWTNDTDWSEVYRGQLEDRISEKDVLIAISVHGGSGPWSGNLVKALEYASDNGAYTVGLSGFEGGKFVDTCDTTLIVKKESTPLVESLHVLIHHMMVFGLKERWSQ
jgi:D-sedoheptulose 7-phosphate isomerase